MNLFERRRKVLEELYYPFFKTQGFKKRANGDVYKDLDNKLVVIIRLVEPRGRSSEAFSIVIGLKLNRRQPTRIKLLEANMENCDASFNIAHLTCLALARKIDEYAYDMGSLFSSEPLMNVGGKAPLTAFINPRRNYKEMIERERISVDEIIVQQSWFDNKDKLASQWCSIFYDLGTFGNVVNADKNNQKFVEDLQLIIAFIKQVVSLESFFSSNTSHLIPNALKDYLRIRLSVCKPQSTRKNYCFAFENKLLLECDRLLLSAQYN